jgi:WD40 repeat protein
MDNWIIKNSIDLDHVSCVDWSPDRTKFVVGLNNIIHIFNASTLKIIFSITGESFPPVFFIKWSMDGSMVLFATRLNIITIFNALSGEMIVTFKAVVLPDYILTSLDWNSDNTRIISCYEKEWDSHNSTIKIWDSISGECIDTFNLDVKTINCVKWSPDNSRIALASHYNDRLYILDIQTKLIIFTLREHQSPIRSIDWSPDGNRIASCGEDTVILIRDALTGQRTLRVQDRTETVNSVQWNNNGTELLSSSSDHTIRIYNSNSGECISILNFDTRLLDAKWSFDNKFILSMSDSGIQIWEKINIPTNDPVELQQDETNQQLVQYRDRINCPVCLVKAKNIIIKKCGHGLCDACYSEILRRNKQCPTCREPLNGHNSEYTPFYIGGSNQYYKKYLKYKNKYLQLKNNII